MEFLDRILSKEGVLAVLVVSLVWWLAVSVTADLNAHAKASDNALQKICVHTAILANRDPSECVK